MVCAENVNGIFTFREISLFLFNFVTSHASCIRRHLAA